MFHEGCSYYSVKSTADRAAKLTIIDRDHRATFRPWRALSAVPVEPSVAAS
jgi:hypothetical protein